MMPPEATKSRGGPAIIILVNERSGAGAAAELLKLPAEGVVIDVPGSGLQATCFSYPIEDPNGFGVQHLAREADAVPCDEFVRCIVAGGDGTLTWAVQKMIDADLPLDRIALGIMPFGTGNDFGNATGWGASGPSRGFTRASHGFRGLQRFVASWLRADVESFDIWEVSVQTHSSDAAGFEFVDGGKKAFTEAHMARHGISRMEGGGFDLSKVFCNYFSLGFESRVGFGFDKHRTKSRVANKAVYFWEGFKKVCFKKTNVIRNIVSGVSVLADASDLPARQCHDPEAVGSRRCLFSTEAESCGPDLVGNPVNLLFLNISSVGGGTDPWRTSKSSGINLQSPKASQWFGDRRIEIMSFLSGVGFSREQLKRQPFAGCGRRIFSGEGPLRMNFKAPSSADYQRGTSHCHGRVYMQVDGEYFAVKEPKSVVVRHHRSILVLVSTDPARGC